MKRLSPITGLAAVAMISMVAVGCGQKQENVSYKKISKSLTPELNTLAERKVDVDRHVKETNNQNTRMFISDWGRAFYTDHPSRLTGMPVTYTSGQPR